MSSYEITFGDIGFNVLKDGKIRFVGLASRTECRKYIAEDQKTDRALAAARERVRQLFESLRDDFQLPANELVTIFREEAKL